MTSERAKPSIDELTAASREARARSLELIADLTDEQLMGPRLAIVNPLRWEIGHVGFFQEFWLLRQLSRRAPMLSQGDALYDSWRVAHDTRWDLPLPSMPDTLVYIQRVLDCVVEEHARGRLEACEPIDGHDAAYFLQLALFHECMHAEAFTYTRQTLGYAAPDIAIAHGGRDGVDAGESRKKLGDAAIPGGTLVLGSAPDQPFVFDNEQWAHPVEVPRFSMARTAVTNGEFAAFVGDRGYGRRDLWSEDGWRWRQDSGAEHPVYWRPLPAGRWLCRKFDEIIPLEEDLPVLHVNWHEAEAYCRWAGRRLPTEAEWEMAASAEPTANGLGTIARKRLYPWGDDPPTPERANLDWRAMGCVSADALPAGDSAFGCRQMIGNVWEWTATTFEPFPGFSPGPYKEYSQPWFGDHKVLRGGCWVTRSRLIFNAYRNFYKPDRRDVWAGFRTCAL